ncbi:hypothetical protein SAY86_032208 [Trapa natans]|uniref:Nodulation signaling pathway 2-like protein n=1 Tax=Trapa natans TaxID=22666 RepID=A0AAN7R882_TRANT|nr:hypothetical protein SAY86_032208 [Trapa natans]
MEKYNPYSIKRSQTHLHSAAAAVVVMAMAAMTINEAVMELDFSGHATTTAATIRDGDYKWSNWSPIVDWDVISGQDDFHGLTEAMITEASHGGGSGRDGIVGMEDYGFLLNSESSDSMTVDGEEIKGAVMAGDEEEDLKGLRLVHLLMAAAEALTGANECHELARVILVRLKELVSPTSDSNIERLAAHFAEALQGILNGGAAAASKHRHVAVTGSGDQGHDEHRQMEATAAFHLLQDMSPYVKFGHFTANQAILEAVVHHRRVHVVDYDIMEGIQWAAFMQALVSRKEGFPAPHLRITALSRGGGGGWRCVSTVQQTGRRLAAFAASVSLPFSFHQCRLDSDESFRPNNLKLMRGEVLIFNCMLHLPHFSYRASHSIASFLAGARTVKPKLVVLSEEEMGSGVEDGGFVAHFMDTLHHFSAIYDSLEAGFPMQSRARELVERIFLGPRIASRLACIYQSHGVEAACNNGSLSWGRCLEEAGFMPAKMSFSNHCQAKLLVGLFNDGYKVEKLAGDRLVLSWKSRPLLSASIWISSSSSSTVSDSES